MFTVSILSLVISTSLSTKSVDVTQVSLAKPVAVQFIAEYDPNDDPGKDLTRDPHDEIHDKDLPSNNPDDYLSGETYPQNDAD